MYTFQRRRKATFWGPYNNSAGYVFRGVLPSQQWQGI